MGQHQATYLGPNARFHDPDSDLWWDRNETKEVDDLVVSYLERQSVAAFTIQAIEGPEEAPPAESGAVAEAEEASPTAEPQPERSGQARRAEQTEPGPAQPSGQRPGFEGRERPS